ncbi:glycosyltransferase family 4 protein [Rossellomorea marisflavi]|uniref:glycosyltransferase family 4 protein n=1 Tax=Rossellomorea marisflavi TaxID=189381 RepID=UPI00203E7FF2|nr:glycosyltransferase family 4 protein [Rossellomorea marisflavi]MCM2604246.1 glycosyltransferase family 4 protein [Rossellomorea marisflavi]
MTDDEKHYLDISRTVSKVDFLFPKKRVGRSIEDIGGLYNLGEFRFSLAYSLFSNGNLAYELYKRYNLPYFVIVQNTDVNFHFKKVPLSKSKGNVILENATKIVFISEAYKKEVIDSFIEKKELIENKAVVIPFGIDDFWRNNTLLHKKERESDILNLLFVGKVNKNKNVSTIIDVVESLNNEGIRTKLNIVGAISHNQTQQRILKSPNINWTPFVNNKHQLLKIYQANDIFVMPSFKESFGLVYGEAMSQGLPVIYTRGQGFDQQFAEGKVGYSVEPDNVLEIKEKIIGIIQNYSEFSSNCVEHVNKFYWENICWKYQDAFKAAEKMK